MPAFHATAPGMQILVVNFATLCLGNRAKLFPNFDTYKLSRVRAREAKGGSSLHLLWRSSVEVKGRATPSDVTASSP
eukprot:1945861-Rhodomonas_salina.1